MLLSPQLASKIVVWLEVMKMDFQIERFTALDHAQKGLTVTCQDLGPKDYLMHKTVNTTRFQL